MSYDQNAADLLRENAALRAENKALRDALKSVRLFVWQVANDTGTHGSEQMLNDIDALLSQAPAHTTKSSDPN